MVVVAKSEKDILKGLTICEIASVIRKDWAKVNYAAKPYLEAMETLRSVTDKYGFDSGESMVAYFLSNANTWKGEIARLVKAELKSRI